MPSKCLSTIQIPPPRLFFVLFMMVHQEHNSFLLLLWDVQNYLQKIESALILPEISQYLITELQSIIKAKETPLVNFTANLIADSYPSKGLFSLCACPISDLIKANNLLKACQIKGKNFPG